MNYSDFFDRVETTKLPYSLSLFSIKLITIITGLMLVFSVNCIAAEKDSVELPELTVTGVKDEQKVKLKLSKIPGGTNLVDLDSLPTSRATLKDVLSTETGVIVQEFFGGNDQPRLNIRGSGIQDNPVNRGIQLLYDGMTINQPDGSFIIGLLDMEQARLISVSRGGNALRYGGASLGGAINLTSRTKLNSNSFARLETGSYDMFNGSARMGFEKGSWDFYIGGGYSRSDGFRDFAESERKNLTANAGYHFNNGVENRTFFNYTDNFFEIPFVLQKEIALSSPESVMGAGLAGSFPPPSSLPAPAVMHPVFGWKARGGWDGVFNVFKRNPNRDSQQLRLANQTIFKTGEFDHVFGIYGEDLDDVFTDPLSHSVVESRNLGINYTLDGHGKWLTRKDEILFSLAFNIGEMPVEYWVNNALDGSRLYQFADLDQDADNLVLGLQYLGSVTDRLQFLAGLQWINSSRDISGEISPFMTRAFSEVDRDFSYDSINPKVGLIYSANKEVRFFANASSSMEAPTFNQLVSRSVGALAYPGAAANPPAVPPFADATLVSGATILDLKKQTAQTFEVGSEGQYKDFSWQLTYYYSKVEDELITLVTDFAVNAETLNYPDDTTHQGIELGLGAVLKRGLFSSMDRLAVKLVYNYSDFTFDGGVFEDNQIAGIPEHLIYAELAYYLGNEFYIGPNIRWQPSDTYIDHSNTQEQDDYLLLGVKVNYRPKPSINLFMNLENLTDETYQTTYVIRGVSAANQPSFLPGTGFHMTAGISYEW